MRVVAAPGVAVGLHGSACTCATGAGFRELMPLWRRRTRHGRVLSLYDLVADDIDLLTHRTAGGRVFADERLNAVLRGFNPTERVVVFAYVENDGTT
ncbi:hypothetical protein ABT255_57880 [Streptomyces mirabilis]|uniref:hypothetical protein n=1 Tax=Streptomyces mirabilis TaxID=68239 RepID=UPI003327A55F